MRARLQTNGGDQAGAVKVAEAFYKQAIESRISVVSRSDTIDFAVTDNGTAVISKGNAYIATPFMSVAGVKTLPLLRANGPDYAKAVLAVGGNAELNLEVSMMLDITGRCRRQKLTDMKAAASDLVNIVVWRIRASSRPRSRSFHSPRTFVCRRAAFNEATGATSTHDPCVVERTGSQKYTDAAPKSGQYCHGAHFASSAPAPRSIRMRSDTSKYARARFTRYNRQRRSKSATARCRECRGASAYQR